MRSKTETSSCLRRYLLEMERLGVTVRNKQSDRGSEYFNQEGNAPEERARVISQFGQVCAEFNVRRVLRPVGQKRSGLKFSSETTSKLLMQCFGRLDLVQHFGWTLVLTVNICGTGLRTLTRVCPRRGKCSMVVKQIGVR
jgi:hypothetical protein